MISEKMYLKPARVSEAWQRKDGYVYFNSYRNVILNQKQTKIWELLDGNHTIADISNILSDYDIDELDAFITKCVEIGFVEYIEEEEWDI